MFVNEVTVIKKKFSFPCLVTCTLGVASFRDIRGHLCLEASEWMAVIGIE